MRNHSLLKLKLFYFFIYKFLFYFFALIYSPNYFAFLLVPVIKNESIQFKKPFPPICYIDPQKLKMFLASQKLIQVLKVSKLPQAKATLNV